MPAYLEIHEAYDGERVRLRLTGELDLCSTPVLRHHLAQLRAEKRLVRLDLSGLRFIDSSGIHLLIGAFNDARDDGQQLAIDSALSPQVHRLFELAAVERIIPELQHERPAACVEETPTAPATTPQRTAFDRALELLELQRAADAYASRHGEPGSATYRAAWLKFRHRIRSIEDLRRMRASSARRKEATQGPPRSSRPGTVSGSQNDPETGA